MSARCATSGDLRTASQIVLPSARQHGDGRDEDSRPLRLAAAAPDEKAGTEAAVVEACAGYRTPDRRLCRADHTAEPVEVSAATAAARFAALPSRGGVVRTCVRPPAVQSDSSSRL